ncbi:MAG TPA: Uma2 family endonuclease [Candidatus Limnocylindrales bacterium]|nr:Uma2 family endonuclease [Candidatus Limnocylindrales bacterium]
MQTAFRSDEKFTQAEFWDWLQELPASDINRYELLGGRIIMTPPAWFGHSAVAVRICTALDRYRRAAGGGLVLESSAGFDLPSGDTLEPDVTFISAGRLAAGPKAPEKGFVKVVPDLVVEVLSPSTARRDRVEKKKVYERCGVDEYWLVDPRRREVTIFTRDGDRFGAGRIFRAGRLDSRVVSGLDLSIEELFADLD